MPKGVEVGHEGHVAGAHDLVTSLNSDPDVFDLIALG
jgi:hypothetical protein